MVMEEETMSVTYGFGLAVECGLQLILFTICMLSQEFWSSCSQNLMYEAQGSGSAGLEMQQMLLYTISHHKSNGFTPLASGSTFG